MKRKTIEAVGVYVSAGGPTIGMLQVPGIDVVAHYTDGGFGFDTRQYNWDIREYTEPETWPVPEAIDFIYCAPPCAPFSSLGRRGDGWEKDDRIKKAWQSVHLGIEAHPKIWLMESVPAFYAKAKSFIKDVEERWLDLGYSVTHFTTGGILHGVPQKRLRWHLIAHRYELVFPDIDESRQVRTVKQAIKTYGLNKHHRKEVQKHPPKLDRIVNQVQPGQRFRNVFMTMAGIREPEDRGFFRGIPGMAYRRLRWNASSPVISGQPRQFMPDENRLYSVAEGLAICGFPSDFTLIGKTKDRYAQIGKGIMPPVARYLGELAYESVLNNKRVRGPKVSIVDFSSQAYALMRHNPPIAKIPAELWDSHPEWRVPKDKYKDRYVSARERQGRRPRPRRLSGV